jgi:pilus assembly protein CpaE
MNSVLRTVIIDSDADSRAAVRRILAGTTTTAIVGEFADVRDATLLEIEARRPDLLVVEVKLDGGDAPGGVRLVEHLVRTFRDTAIFVTAPPTTGDLPMRLLRAGAFEYLPRPLDRADVLAGLDKVARVRRGIAPARRVGRVTSIFSPRGGLGATTIAANVAVCLARQAPDSTLLVDFDTRQSDVATFLALRPAYSVLDAFENIERLDEMFLRGLLVKHASGLWILPGPSRVERFSLTAEQVRAGLEIVRSHFDHVVLDLRHDLDPGTVAALEASDTILFLTALTVSALRSSAAALAAFRHLVINSQKVRLVVMRETSGGDVTLRHVKESLGVAASWRVPSDWQTAVAAVNAGEPLVTMAPRSKIARTVAQVAASLTATGSEEAEPRKSGSLLRALLSPTKLVRAS